MLSRFSSLFTYVIVGLVISAAATPLNPLADALGDRAKSLSRPPSMMSNDKGKPYDDKDKPYNDKDKPYNDKDKPYDDKDKPYDDKDKPYGNKDKHYDEDRSERHGQCSVEKQHCCNQVNQASETSKLDSFGSSILGLDVIVGLIKESNQLWGFDCTPILGFNSACSNQQVCCENNHQNGLIVVGCNNINLI